MTTEDFCKLVAIFIHFGYKNSDMPLGMQCFKSLLRSIHCTNNEFESFMASLQIVDKKTVIQLKDIKDRLLKVWPLCDHISDQCQKYCHPNMKISIDEGMVGPHFSIKQCLYNKPTK